MFKKNILISVLLAIGLLVLSPVLVHGQGLIPADHHVACQAGQTGSNCCPAGYTGNNCGDYGVNDFIVLAIKVSSWVLGIVGSLALIMFIYGGFMFLISAGSAEAVGKAKKIITAAVIGLVIVFASYLIIQFVLKSLGLNWNGQIAIPTVTMITTLSIS